MERVESLFTWAALLSLLTLALIACIDFPLHQTVPASTAALLIGSLVSRRAKSLARTTHGPAMLLKLTIALVLVAFAGRPIFHRALLGQHLGIIRAAIEDPRSVAARDLARHAGAAVALGIPPLEADRFASALMPAGGAELVHAVMRDAIPRDPLWFDHWRWEAEALMALEQPDLAVQAADRAVALAPELRLTWLTLAKARRAAGDLDSAVAALQRAMQLDPENPEYPELMAQWYLREGRSNEAIAQLDAALRANPGEARLWEMLGRAHLNLEQPNVAQLAFEQAIHFDPRRVQSMEQLALIHLSGRRSAQAEELLRRALAIDPNSSTLHSIMGTALATQHRTAEARVAIEEALRLDPENASAWRGLGLLETQEGHPELAPEPLVRAFRLDPEDEITRQALRALGINPDRLGR